MTKLDRLLQQFCSDGVEYQRLGDIAKVLRGKRLTKNQLSEENIYPVYHGGLEPLGFYSEKNRDANTVMVINVGASAGTVGFCDKDFWSSDGCFCISHNSVTIPKYLYFALLSQERSIVSKVRYAGIPTLDAKVVEGLSIPIPPLPIQEEIVRILDELTEKTNNLICELNAEYDERKKQYAQYKKCIFDSILNHSTKHITDIAQIKARVGWQRLTRGEYLSSGEYCLITGTDFMPDGRINFDSCVYVTKERFDMDENIQIHKNDILITKDGTLGKVAIVLEEPQKPTTLNSGVFRIKITDSQISAKYMYHFFTSKYFTDFVESVKTGSTVPHLTQQGLVTLDIPIPSLEEQNQIVSKLDTLNQVYTKIIEELSFEIETRKKQYEYYRDKLLSFDCV